MKAENVLLVGRAQIVLWWSLLGFSDWLAFSGLVFISVGCFPLARLLLLFSLSLSLVSVASDSLSDTVQRAGRLDLEYFMNWTFVKTILSSPWGQHYRKHITPQFS